MDVNIERDCSALQAALDLQTYTDDPENGFKTVSYLVSNGADVTQSGVLTEAAYCSDAKLVAFLLDAGADINAAAQHRTTPLMMTKDFFKKK